MFLEWTKDKPGKLEPRLQQFVRSHPQYHSVNVHTAAYWVSQMKSKSEHGNFKLTKADVDAIREAIRQKRAVTPNGGGKRVTTKSIKAMIQEFWKKKRGDEMREHDEVGDIVPLNTKTIDRYFKDVTKGLQWYNKSRKKNIQRIVAETDIRNELSYIAMLNVITKLQSDSPLQPHTTVLPPELLFNIDSKTYVVDPGNRNCVEGTWDDNGKTDVVIATNDREMPYTVRLTLLVNGAGRYRAILAFKFKNKNCKKSIVKIPIPGQPNICIYCMNGPYSDEYFSEQVSICCVCW
jgi:hypothetical protein